MPLGKQGFHNVTAIGEIIADIQNGYKTKEDLISCSCAICLAALEKLKEDK